MNEWAQPVGAMLIVLAVVAYLVQRRAYASPEWRRLGQLVTAMMLVLLVALLYLVLQSVVGGLPQ